MLKIIDSLLTLYFYLLYKYSLFYSEKINRNVSIDSGSLPFGTDKNIDVSWLCMGTLFSTCVLFFFNYLKNNLWRS